ncbi:hypothetical protein [Luteimonas huabeiensis]|uniref:hypothetical protein n=1 Tax=Luteimonas huabeiensis TaxID=1244513 RepID=UPI000467A0E0|nr:hypothetical protein [Luteimonas huabeiensis]
MNVPKHKMKQKGKTKASCSAEQPTQGGGFLKALSGAYDSKPAVMRTQEPYFIWVSNVSNDGLPAEVNNWLGMDASLDFDNLTKNLKSLYVNCRPMKEYLGSLREEGKGDPTASAITIICLQCEGEHSVDVDVVVASSSLNQHSCHGNGQIHAEHISTELAVDAVGSLDQILKSPDIGAPKRCSIIIYACDKKGSNFSPCISCQKTVTASLRNLKEIAGKIDGIYWEYVPKM